ncbi:unnamed protein product [Boreogadus saida]
MNERNGLSFTPTLGLSLNKREKDQSSPGTQTESRFEYTSGVVTYLDQSYQSYPDQSSQSFPLSFPL